MGSWITYGLGTENENLPGFVVLCPGYPVLGAQLWTRRFCHRSIRGPISEFGERDPDEAAGRIFATIHTGRRSSRRAARRCSIKLDRAYRAAVWATSRSSKQASQTMEVAFRMQTEAPETFRHLKRDRVAIRERYGDHDFGRGCLMALRLVERGMRMVQVYFGNFQPWDSHDDIRMHAKLAHAARWLRSRP